MRAPLLILVAAVTLGLAGGYAWSVMNAGPSRPSRPAKAATIALPASPEEQPAVLDQEWAASADDHSATVPPGTTENSVHYAGCNEVRAAGKAPLNSGDPGYSAEMDGDHDGIACEPIRAK